MSAPAGAVVGAPAGTVLPRWLWLWLAPGTILVEFVFHWVRPDAYDRWFGGEHGVIENLTNVYAITGLVVALVLFTRRRAVASRWFGPAMLVIALGCFVFAGEEMSWGQHLVGFEVPDEIAARNDQRELNLHNDPFLEPLFDFWARNTLSWGALIGGVIVPLVRHRRGRGHPEIASPSLWGWAIPTILCVPTALTVIGVTLPPRVFGLMHVATPYPFPWNISWSESKEYDLALLILVYVLTLLRYVPGRGASAAAGGASAASGSAPVAAGGAAPGAAGGGSANSAVSSNRPMGGPQASSRA